MKTSNTKFDENTQIWNFMKSSNTKFQEILKYKILWKTSNTKFHENTQIWNFMKSSNMKCHEILKYKISWKTSNIKFHENPQIWNFMKIRPFGAEFFHTDRQTHMTKLIVAFTGVFIRKETISEPCKGRARFQQHRDAMQNIQYCSVKHNNH